MTPFYRVLRAIVKLPVYLFFRIKKYGVDNIPKEGPVIICCNHTSISDIFFIALLCPRQVYFMAKDELFKTRLLNWFFTKLGAFPVNRRTGDKAAVNKAAEILSGGRVLGIFPEGTRHTDGAPHKAKPGAAMLALSNKVPIIPSAVYRSKAKVSLFQKVTFRFGKVIPFEEYGTDEVSKNDIRRVSDLITEKITELWEMKH